MRRGWFVLIFMAVLMMGAVGTNVRNLEEFVLGGGFDEATDGGMDAEDDGTLTSNGSATFEGGLVAGKDGTDRGALTLWDGSGGSAPAYIRIATPNGTTWYIFAADDGTLRYCSTVPTSNSDGSTVGLGGSGTQEQVEDWAGAMASGNTETLITVTYQDADGTIDYVVNSNLHSYSWASVDATDLKVGSVTQAYDADLDDLADGSLDVSKIDFGTGTASYVWTSDGAGAESWASPSAVAEEDIQDIIGAMFAGNTENRITIEYQDIDGTIDAEVLDDLSYYSWANVDGTDLKVGSITQAYSAYLTAIAALARTDGNIIVGNGTTWVAESGATARTSLGLSIGSDVQAYDAQLADVAGLAVTDGGFIVGDGANFVLETGATALASIGAQASDAQLTDVAGLTPTDGNIIIGDGANFVCESGATARTSLGLAIGTNVQAYDAQLADVAGLAVTDGGFIVGNGANFVLETGATALASIGAQASDAQLTDVAGLTPSDGNFIVGDGANFVAESGATARTSLGLGSAATRDAEDSLTNGSNLPDGAAITSYVTGLGYITNDSSVPKGDLSSDGSLGFDWPDGDVANDLTIEGAPELGCAENEITSITDNTIDVAGKSYLVFDLASADSVDTFSNPTAGQILTLVNIDDTNAVTLTDDDGNIDIQGADNDVVLNVVGEAYTLQYVTTDATNKWILIGPNPNAAGGGGMTSFTLTADSGTNQTVADSNTMDIEGGDGIDTVVGATDKVTVAIDATVLRSVSEGPSFQTHFLGATLPDECTVSTGGTGSTSAFLAGVGGWYRLTAGTAQNASAFLNIASSGTYPSWTAAKNCAFSARMLSAAMANAGSAIYVGLTNSAFITINDMALFRLLKGTNSDKWQCLTANDGTATTGNTSVGYTSEQTLEIICASDSVAFYIDDSLVATHTTNLPNETMWCIAGGIQAGNPGTAWAMDLNYVEIGQDE